MNGYELKEGECMVYWGSDGRLMYKEKAWGINLMMMATTPTNNWLNPYHPPLPQISDMELND
jgi:hypothetical protein